MRRPILTSRWSSALALPLALWSTLPGIQWCRVGWAEVRLECFAECSIERSDCRASPCAAGASVSDARSKRPAALPPNACGLGDIPARGCPSGLAECALGPCAPGDESPDGLPGGRAYCLSGPLGGQGIPTIPPGPPDQAPQVAIVPEAIARATPAAGAERPVARTTSGPPISAIGAVNRIRAPPGAGPTTC